MNKKIQFTYKDVPYTLEYDRNIIKRMETAGLVMEEVSKKPMSQIDILFKGAFIKHHRNIKEELMDEIYNKFTNKDSLANTLIEMVSEQYETLLGDTKDDEGNIDWDVVG